MTTLPFPTYAERWDTESYEDFAEDGLFALKPGANVFRQRPPQPLPAANTRKQAEERLDQPDRIEMTSLLMSPTTLWLFRGCGTSHAQRELPTPDAV